MSYLMFDIFADILCKIDDETVKDAIMSFQQGNEKIEMMNAIKQYI